MEQLVMKQGLSKELCGSIVMNFHHIKKLGFILSYFQHMMVKEIILVSIVSIDLFDLTYYTLKNLA